MADVTTLTIPISEELAQQLPEATGSVEQLLRLGLKELHLRKAFAALRRGEGTLAYHAAKLGIPLREIIPLAYAHGLIPPDPGGLTEADLDFEQAQQL